MMALVHNNILLFLREATNTAMEKIGFHSLIIYTNMERKFWLCNFLKEN
jgi:hypothetical protein